MWDTNEIKIELTLIRHGKTKGNLEHRYIGRTDECLLEESKRQLEKIEMPRVDFVFSSPMKRCLETAHILYKKQEIQIIEEFMEMDFGDFEGCNFQELDGNEDYQRFIDSNGEAAFPGGEERESFIKRTLSGLNRLKEYVYINEKNESAVKVCAVVHGGTIMALCSQVMGGNYYDYQIKNAESITLVI